MLPDRWKNALASLNPLEPVKPEAAFYPPALEILETPAAPLARLTSLTIVALLSCALIWACFGEVDIYATAPGRIVTSGRAKLVQPLEAGIVRKIHVGDGQHVKEGDVLIEIDPTITAADTARLKVQLIDKQLEKARLTALLDAPQNPAELFHPPASATSEQIALHTAVLKSEAEKNAAAIAGLDEQISQARATSASISATITKLEKSLAFLTKRSSIYQYLDKKGYGSKLQLLQAQQQLTDNQQELLVQKERLTAAEATLAATKQRRAETVADRAATMSKDLAKAQQEEASLTEQLVQAEAKLQRQSLKAPVTGTVQQLSVHTEGGVVQPAQTLLVVVPDDGGLEVEAAVANADIGFVREGQEATVKVDSFNFTKYGVLNGSIMVLSRDSVPATPSKANSQTQDSATSVYLARIALEKSQMRIDGKTVDLTPGMTVVAEIKTGRRTIMEYVISPLQSHLQNSLHER